MGTSDASKVTRTIEYLQAHWQEQPGLDELASAVGLSGPHFQRLFRRWAGVSPKRFLQYLTAEHARGVLLSSASVLDASYAVGLSGPGRLHDLTINVHALTPGEMRRQGEGVTVRYGAHPTPFGECLLAATSRGICRLAFVGPEGAAACVRDVAARWPRARLVEDAGATGTLARRAFDTTRPAAVLDVRGTNFQIRVWEALLKVPEAALVAYGDLAEYVGKPGAARAVGAAVAANPIGYLIPCHRVIRATGAFGDYRWGSARKKAIHGWEVAREHVARSASTVKHASREGVRSRP